MERSPITVLAPKSPEALQTLPVNSVSPLQASIQEVASQGEVQRFQMFPVIDQPDAQENIMLMHVPIPFKQLKKLKTACNQCGPIAAFTTTLLKVFL